MSLPTLAPQWLGGSADVFALNRDGRVTIKVSTCLPVGGEVLWNSMRDIRHFLTLDILHHDVRLGADTPALGVPIRIRHGANGHGVDRQGRIVRWMEGHSFAVSDLSLRNPRRGFPHVLIFEIAEASQSRSVLEIRVRGRWTLPWIPRPIALLWFRTVMGGMVMRIRREMRHLQSERA